VSNTFFFISKGILDQISIALSFIILAPKFECVFGKANCRSLSERLLLVKHSQSGSNWALQCLQFIHLGLGGKLTLHCCASSHIFRTEKVFQQRIYPLFPLLNDLNTVQIWLPEKNAQGHQKDNYLWKFDFCIFCESIVEHHIFHIHS